MRDPDGRFRVSDLYCHDDTWRPTLQALLDASDLVLMDLRSFSQQNAGCIFELEQILAHVPTDSIVLVCDRTTDLNLLGRTLAGAWDQARREGFARGSGRIAIVNVEHQNREEIAMLMRRLLGAGEPARVLPVAELTTAI